MFTAMAVDDEIWTLRGIKKLVPWEEYGFELDRTFTDPRAALESFRELPADVVFVDVNMPGMDGLTLIQKMKEESAGAQFVILTAYSEFEYAKQAISLQVADYLVKPVTEDMLRAAMNKLRERQEKKEILVRRDRIYHRLLQSETGLTGDELSRLTQLNCAPGTELILFAQCGGDDALSRALPESCLFQSPDGRFHFSLCAGTPEELRSRGANMEEAAASLGRIIGCSGAFADPRGGRAALRRAQLSACHDFFDGQCGVFQSSDTAALPEAAGCAVRLIQDREWKCAVRTLKELPDACDPSWSVSDALHLYQHVAAELKVLDIQLPPIWSEESLLCAYPRFSQMCLELSSAMLELFSSESVEILKVESYIRNHFNRPELCVQYIADVFGVDAGYLGRKYRRQMNQSIGQDIQKIRLEYACKLLKETGITVREIARLCGYEDPFYFNKVFKKAYKTTPMQYRKIQNVQ